MLMTRNFLVGDYFLNRRKLRYWKKGYFSLVLWMSSTAPRNPMIIAAGIVMLREILEMGRDKHRIFP